MPTRDRLEYLKLAVETIRRQDCPDWEIVISDNDSSDDVPTWPFMLGAVVLVGAGALWAIRNRH